MSTKPLSIKIAALSVVLLTFAFSAPAWASEKESVLRSSEQVFGPVVDKQRHLFEANRFYILRVSFSKKGDLEELAVEPKFYFEESHPEWQQTAAFAYLSQTDYETLLAKLEWIKTKGVLVKAASGGGPVTNMTLWNKTVYEKAILEWGEVVDLRRGESPPLLVRWFRVKYSKPA